MDNLLIPPGTLHCIRVFVQVESCSNCSELICDRGFWLVLVKDGCGGLCGSLNDEIAPCWNRQIYFKIIINTESTVDCSIQVVRRMFAKTLATNWFAKDCVVIANKIARDWDWKIGHLTIVLVYLYRPRVYRKVYICLCLTVTCSGDIVLAEVGLLLHYVYRCITMFLLRGKTTTWLELSSSSCAATYFSSTLIRSSNRSIIFMVKVRAENSYHRNQSEECTIKMKTIFSSFVRMKIEGEKIHRMRKYLDIFGQEDHQLQLSEVKIQELTYHTRRLTNRNWHVNIIYDSSYEFRLSNV